MIFFDVFVLVPVRMYMSMREIAGAPPKSNYYLD